MTLETTRRALSAVALILTACASPAHDWPSPSVERRADEQRSPAPTPDAWSGRVWAGPAAGRPAPPSAVDCKRPPAWMDLPGPTPLRPQQRAHLPSAVSSMGRSADAAKASEPVRLSGSALAAPATSPEPAEAVPAPRAAPAPSRRPASEPVTAGVVDDNVDFGEYLAYRQRALSRGLNVRDLDIGERYRLSVHDAAGRPVPDAVVSVHAGSQPWPLWARTDAGGQAWLHPRAAGLTDRVLEVRVTSRSADGELRGSAFLRRGQRDALQVRLDGTAPVERARLDLLFLIDATGSMADEIDKLKRSMQAMADQIARLPSRPDVCWGLVAYRDRGDEFFVRAHDFTDDLGAFQQVLSSLQARAGGDYPEAMNEALHTAVHRLSWRGDGATRLVVLVADAPPHLDYPSPHYDDDMQGALARGIKLFGVAASGLDPSGEYIQRQIAQYTGGRFVFLTYERATDPRSGPGRETAHDVGNYSVETLDRLVVRLVREELARRPG